MLSARCQSRQAADLSIAAAPQKNSCDSSGSVPDVPPELFVGPNYRLRTGGEVDDSWEFATKFFCEIWLDTWNLDS